MTPARNSPKLTKLAVLISNKGTGTNLQAVIDAIVQRKINCQIAIVISDRSNALGLKRAQRHNIPSKIIQYESGKMNRDTYGKKLGRFLNGTGAEIAILAGFSTILPLSYFETFNGVTINTHPGLIPDREEGIFYFPDGSVAPWNKGLMTDEAVKNFLGLKYAGSTWHVATVKADSGPVLKRVIVQVELEDMLETLYARLKVAEHRGLIEILKNPPRILNHFGFSK